MKKRVISLVIISALMLFMMSTFSFAAQALYAGGSGTEEDPYLISTADQLNKVRNNRDAHFKMTNDIVFEDADYEKDGKFYNNGRYFYPIGTNRTSAFTGTFDGGGYKIKNIRIHYESTQIIRVGLFGYNTGTIKNLGLVGGSITVILNDLVYVGGIAGVNRGTISNCYNTANVTGRSTNEKASSVNVGGITAFNNGIIEKCYNKGNIGAVFFDGNTAVGGIAGVNHTTISQCYNRGSITGEVLNGYIGGVVGSHENGTVIDCYNKGKAYAPKKSYLGGIVGHSTAKLERCFDDGWLLSETVKSSIGAIAGWGAAGSSAIDCYYNMFEDGIGSGTDTTTAISSKEKLNQQSTYVNFDFKNVWMFLKEENGPVLRALHKHEYWNKCDSDCDTCGEVRVAPHTYGNYHSDNNATIEKDGTKTRTCWLCGYNDTVTEVGSKLEKTDSSKMFTDIKAKAWYKEYVDYSVTYGIFTGTSKTKFSPNDSITRAQFVQVLANLSGVDTSNRNVTTAFKDVPAKKWFTPAVKWASENKIVNGVGDGKFDPNANVTREQMCVMLVNYAKFKSITLKTVENKENFADDNKISKWAKSAVYTCQQADIVNGKGEGKFDPKGTGTRAEASVIFTKFHKAYLVK